MKVALLTRAIHPLHGRGGLERHTAALKRYLERAGCDVRVFTQPPFRELSEPRDETYTFTSSRMLPWPRRPGFVVLERNTNYLIWSVRAARELIGSFEPDIVQADGGAGFGYARLGAGKHAPLVLHPHGMEEFKATALKRAAYFPLRNAIRYAAARAARVIAPDQSMQEEVQKLLGVEQEKIALIPNAIDIEEIDRRPDSEISVLDLDARDTVLLSVGRLEANKGFVDLAKALGGIRKEMPEHWKWVLVGEGSQRETIERVVNERGIAPKTPSWVPSWVPSPTSNSTRCTNGRTFSSTRRDTKEAPWSRSKRWRTANPSSRRASVAFPTRWSTAFPGSWCHPTT